MRSLIYVDVKYVFASASEIGALILYFTKLILRIQKKLESIVNIFCPLYKNFMSKKRIPPLVQPYSF